jgi:hypothetical protein
MQNVVEAMEEEINSNPCAWGRTSIVTYNKHGCYLKFTEPIQCSNMLQEKPHPAYLFTVVSPTPGTESNMWKTRRTCH